MNRESIGLNERGWGGRGYECVTLVTAMLYRQTCGRQVEEKGTADIEENERGQGLM